MKKILIILFSVSIILLCQNTFIGEIATDQLPTITNIIFDNEI